MRHLFAVAMLLSVAACGGGGGGDSAAATSIPNQSVGGIWQGTDSDGDDIVGLVTESGQFHFIDAFGQGYGTATVSNGNQVSANYTYVADLGTEFVDGSTSASCTLTGTVVERKTLNVNSQCTSTKGSQSSVSVTLSYNSIYDRDASLATIAGNYDDLGDILNISSGGVVFEQDADDGCVLNGQVAVVNPAYNTYTVNFSVSNCNAIYAELNGTQWSGIATLDNTASPEELVFGVVGNVTVSGSTATFALVGLASRT